MMDFIKRSLVRETDPKTQQEPARLSPFEHIALREGSTPPWYRSDEELSSILAPDMQQLLSRLTKKDSSALEKHIVDIRRKAWAHGQYPAIGGFRFVRPVIRQHPLFAQLCARLKNGASLLELGPGLGQDLQLLISEGVPSDKLYAIDNRPELWHLGLQLFGAATAAPDSGKKTTDPVASSAPHFIAADLINSSWADDFLEKHGQVDIILANQFFDTISDAYSAAIMRWLRPLLKPGSIIVGYQMGADQPFESDDVFYHNRLSWWGNWQAISKENMQRDIRMGLDLYETADLVTDWKLDPKEFDWIQKGGLHGVYFVVRRIE